MSGMSDIGTVTVTEAEPPVVWRRVVGARRPVPDVLIDYLLSEEVDTVFGVPGGAIIPVLAAIERTPGMRFVLAKHEGGAAFMADCYARVSGKTGVCLATTGPGATNLLTGIAAAYADSVPLLVLTGMNPVHAWGMGDFQESSAYGIDTVGLFRHVTKRSDVVVSEKLLQPLLRRAFAVANSGRPGPVHLALPRDVLARSVSPDLWPPQTYRSAPLAADADEVSRVAHALRHADRPLILIGSGTPIGAAEVLAAISNELVVPMIATPRAKGLFSGCSAHYYLGTMGIAARAHVDQFLAAAGCDLVLSIGAGFGSYATNSWDPGLRQGRMVQVNIDAEAIGRVYPVDLGIVSDAGAFAHALRRALTTHPAPEVGVADTGERAQWLAPYLAVPASCWPRREESCADRLLSPIEVICSVDRAVPERGIIMVDSGSMLLWATHYLPEVRSRRFIGVWGAASMGHVTAGAIGARFAAPDRAVLALVGDGCFFMNGMEIATAAEWRLPIVWVVNANGQLGMIHYEQRASGLTASSEFARRDLVKVAIGLGAHALVCRDVAELTDAICEGFARTGPTVIQVDVDPGPVPPLGQKKAGGARWQEYINCI
ncbi:MAG: thiamine pyrophosphate-binding protein [Acidiferrobacteraceae bacterium]